MKKYTLILFLFVMGLQAISQSSKKITVSARGVDTQKKIDSVCKLIVVYSNQKSTEKLYDLTGPTFRKSMNYETFKKSAEGHLYPLNKIIKTELLEHKNGLSIYKI